MDTGKQGLVGEGFEPCAHFQGARPGFVFKRGLWGVGYYHDLLAAPREAQPPPRAPDGVVRPQPQRCHYEVLGVAMEANDDELRRAYRRLALKVSWRPHGPARALGLPVSRRRARARISLEMRKGVLPMVRT